MDSATHEYLFENYISIEGTNYGNIYIYIYVGELLPNMFLLFSTSNLKLRLCILFLGMICNVSFYINTNYHDDI